MSQEKTETKQKKYKMTHRGFLQAKSGDEFVTVGTFSLGKDQEGRLKQIVNIDITKFDLISKLNGTIGGFVNEYDPAIEKKAREMKKELYNKKE